MASTIQVSLSDIRAVSLSELEQHKLNSLENGRDSFERILSSAGNPIALDRGKPHDITDGRHRIYLARKKGLRTVPAIFV
jgi:hypothetical protein